uniref:CSON011082 protein n=1 Tax=Culicoides sonorensis TaxID=179676 RepID=A0A336LLG0_CULSO
MVKTRINIHMDNFDDHAKDILKDIYQNSLNFDIILRVGKRKFPAHKAVLAFGSDFLKEMIEENAALQPGITPNISIADVDPEIIEQVLNFIYTGETRLKEERFMEFVDVCNLLKLKSMANYEYVKYINVSEENQGAEGTSNTQPEQPQYMDNVTIIGDDYAEIVKSVTQEEVMNEEGVVIYPNSLPENSGYDVIEVIEQQTTEDENFETKYQPSTKRKRLSAHLREGDPQYKENLDNAMHDIIYNKMSFKTASEKYNLSKTILWRLCQQSPEYQSQKDNPGNQELNNTLLEELTNGETLLSISRKYSIPVSTLHRRKTMLWEKGELPENVRIKQRNRGEDFAQRLESAIREVENGLSQTEAAKKYRIPKTTIWRRLKRTNPKLAIAIKMETGSSEEQAYEIIEGTMKHEQFRIIESSQTEDDESYKIMDTSEAQEVQENQEIVNFKAEES